MSNFHVIVDNITDEVLTKFGKKANWEKMVWEPDAEWDCVGILEYGHEVSHINYTARFFAVKHAQEVIDFLTESMKSNGETKFDFEIVKVETEVKEFINNSLSLKETI